MTSPWSEKWSFNTTLNPVVNQLQLESPAAGSLDIPRKPLFQWTGVIGADTYELLVATNPDFTDPVINREKDSALPSNAWQSDFILDYATTYYWKVRALAGGARSVWSPTGSFATEFEPSSMESGQVAGATLPDNNDTIPPQITPLPQAQLSANTNNAPPSAPSPALPDWAFYLIGAQAAIIAFALVVILVLVLTKRRS